MVFSRGHVFLQNPWDAQKWFPRFPKSNFLKDQVAFHLKDSPLLTYPTAKQLHGLLQNEPRHACIHAASTSPWSNIVTDIVQYRMSTGPSPTSIGVCRTAVGFLLGISRFQATRTCDNIYIISFTLSRVWAQHEYSMFTSWRFPRTS